MTSISSDVHKRIIAQSSGCRLDLDQLIPMSFARNNDRSMARAASAATQGRPSLRFLPNFFKPQDREVSLSAAGFPISVKPLRGKKVCGCHDHSEQPIAGAAPRRWGASEWSAGSLTIASNPEATSGQASFRCARQWRRRWRDPARCRRSLRPRARSGL